MHTFWTKYVRLCYNYVCKKYYLPNHVSRYTFLWIPSILFPDLKVCRSNKITHIKWHDSVVKGNSKYIRVNDLRILEHTSTLLNFYRNGVLRSGLFIAANYVLERIKTDKEVDVFQAVKQMRLNRPQLIDNLVGR